MSPVGKEEKSGGIVLLPTKTQRETTVVIIMDFRERLIVLREEKGLSQQQFADRLGVSRQTIFRWESGKSVPSAAQIKNICSEFGLDANEFLSGEKSEDGDAGCNETALNGCKSAEENADGAGETKREKCRRNGRKPVIVIAAVIAAIVLVALVITVCYAVKDAIYDSSATVWIISLPSNTPMLVLSVVLAAILGVAVFALVREIWKKD